MKDSVKKNRKVNKVAIVFYNEKGEAIYSIDAFHYSPHTLSDVGEEPAS